MFLNILVYIYIYIYILYYISISYHIVYLYHLNKIVSIILIQTKCILSDYEVNISEFIGGEHTAKNVMISAVKKKQIKVCICIYYLLFCCSTTITIITILNIYSIIKILPQHWSSDEKNVIKSKIRSLLQEFNIKKQKSVSFIL